MELQGSEVDVDYDDTVALLSFDSLEQAGYGGVTGGVQTAAMMADGGSATGSSAGSASAYDSLTANFWMQAMANAKPTDQVLAGQPRHAAALPVALVICLLLTTAVWRLHS